MSINVVDMRNPASEIPAQNLWVSRVVAAILDSPHLTRHDAERVAAILNMVLIDAEFEKAMAMRAGAVPMGDLRKIAPTPEQALKSLLQRHDERQELWKENPLLFFALYAEAICDNRTNTDVDYFAKFTIIKEWARRAVQRVTGETFRSPLWP